MPKDIRFKIKPQIALDQIREAHAEGFASGIVLADAGWANSDFRAGVSALNLPYVVGIQSTPSGCPDHCWNRRSGIASPEPGWLAVRHPCEESNAMTDDITTLILGRES